MRRAREGTFTTKRVESFRETLNESSLRGRIPQGAILTIARLINDQAIAAHEMRRQDA
jgi:hypothetical protein